MGSANAWPKMKDCRSETSSVNLKFVQLTWNLSVKRIVTGDETRIHHDDPETKQQSMHWKHASFPSLQKFTVQASASKIMCTVFWDAEDVLLIGYMPHKVAVIGIYNTDLLHKFHVAIKQKCREKLTNVPLLLRDNAPAHRSHVGQATLLECGFEEMRHPPLFSWSGTKLLASIAKLKETSLWSKIFERWGAQVCDR